MIDKLPGVKDFRRLFPSGKVTMSDQDTAERCEICRYSVVRQLHQSEALECHLYGPRGVPLEGWAGRDDGIWPTIRKDDWCGQFEPKEAGPSHER